MECRLVALLSAALMGYRDRDCDVEDSGAEQ